MLCGPGSQRRRAISRSRSQPFGNCSVRCRAASGSSPCRGSVQRMVKEADTVAGTGIKTGPAPDAPSILVLPFENRSGDRQQDYLADGITEDIIIALTRFRWFRVIGRNSSFATGARLFRGSSAILRSVMFSRCLAQVGSADAHIRSAARSGDGKSPMGRAL